MLTNARCLGRNYTLHSFYTTTQQKKHKILLTVKHLLFMLFVRSFFWCVYDDNFVRLFFKHPNDIQMMKILKSVLFELCVQRKLHRSCQRISQCRSNGKWKKYALCWVPKARQLDKVCLTLYRFNPTVDWEFVFYKKVVRGATFFHNSSFNGGLLTFVKQLHFLKTSMSNWVKLAQNNTILWVLTVKGDDISVNPTK